MLAPDTIPRIEAAARQALAESRPTLPTQRVQIGPDEWREVENPLDEAYQQALTAWEQQVVEERGKRFVTLCEQYALVFEVDDDEVQAFKAAHAAAGIPLDPEESDEAIFLWRIALPTPEDHMAMYGKLFGGLTEEAIQAQKASFRSQLQGANAL